ncbi:MAG TPA: hypothetical protein VHV29_16535 [Terriglobales bacterium]|jgi:pectin methylesterase-like acyl-CoA thioesterase|nr:hypothetical protein [Terriglobales bacterium]
MKIVLSILLAAAFSLSVLAQSQDQSPSQGQSGSQGTQNPSGQMQNGNTSTGSQNMSGTVSHNGKDFTNDRNSQKYRVDNPGTLSGKEDQHVALLVQVDPDNNVIHVIQIEPPPQ